MINIDAFTTDMYKFVKPNVVNDGFTILFDYKWIAFI